MDTAFTIEQFKSALPDQMRKSINQELIDRVNTLLSDPDMFETYRENLLSYTNVLTDGRFQAHQYISAVKYVSHKLRGKSNLEAFTLTFPEKIQRWTNEGVEGKDQASYITAYNKSKLVMLIMEQTMVPMHVLNMDLYQKALNKQAELMMTANSEKVQCEAANSLLTHLKPPETTKIQIDVGAKKGSIIDQLREGTLALVEQQRRMLAAGAMNAQQVAHQPILIEAEAEVIHESKS